MPIAGVAGGQGPFDRRQGEAISNLRIGEDVFRIIEIDQFIMGDRPIDTRRNRAKTKADQEDSEIIFLANHNLRVAEQLFRKSENPCPLCDTFGTV